MMIDKLSFTLLLITTSILHQCANREEPPQVLVFTRTEGYRHESIEAGVEAFRQLGIAYNFMVWHTEDAEAFHPERLENIDAVVFLNTTGDVLNDQQQEALQGFIQGGNGFVGVHSASDTEYGWPWYGKMVGAYFLNHPPVQEAQLYCQDCDHPATEMWPDTFIRKDEWYNFRDFNPDVHVLLYLDESSYEGGSMGGEHPVSWWHEYDGGRAFYTAMGHTVESFEEDPFLQHLWQGLRFAMDED